MGKTLRRLETGSLGSRTGLFLIIFCTFDHMIVYQKLWCLWNGWKCMHDTIHWMEYWTIAWCRKIFVVKISDFHSVNNDELISGFTLPSSSPYTDRSSQQQHRRTPWQSIQQIDISYAGCEYMYPWMMVYYTTSCTEQSLQNWVL